MKPNYKNWIPKGMLYSLIAAMPRNWISRTRASTL